MRITIDGFEENLIKRKQISVDGYGRTRRLCRLLKDIAVIMNKVLSGGSSNYRPHARDSTRTRAITSRQK